MGIVYHGAYVTWFEVGRTEYCRAAGFPYRRMEDDGLLILVTRVECVYRSPARYDDSVRVRARLTELSGRGVALPKIATAPSSAARFAATVRAS